jgi:fructose-bisphosphate aldolase class I
VLPTAAAIQANAHALARYAALCQEAGLVPMVEPEVLMDGDHTMEEHATATEWILNIVYDELFALRVDLTGTILKTNMALSGKSASTQASVQEVAEATLRVLRATVPPAVPGIAFLSGGQDDVAATARLDAMNRMGPHPWELSFSYGRALQAPALKAWGGAAENVEAGQRALVHRARCNGAARDGTYSPDMENAA